MSDFLMRLVSRAAGAPAGRGVIAAPSIPAVADASTPKSGGLEEATDLTTADRPDERDTSAPLAPRTPSSMAEARQPSDTHAPAFAPPRARAREAEGRGTHFQPTDPIRPPAPLDGPARSPSRSLATESTPVAEPRATRAPEPAPLLEASPPRPSVTVLVPPQRSLAGPTRAASEPASESLDTPAAPGAEPPSRAAAAPAGPLADVRPAPVPAFDRSVPRFGDPGSNQPARAARSDSPGRASLDADTPSRGEDGIAIDVSIGTIELTDRRSSRNPVPRSEPPRTFDRYLQIRSYAAHGRW